MSVRGLTSEIFTSLITQNSLLAVEPPDAAGRPKKSFVHSIAVRASYYHVSYQGFTVLQISIKTASITVQRCDTPDYMFAVGPAGVIRLIEPLFPADLSGDEYRDRRCSLI
jgi:hypothetical protein